MGDKDDFDRARSLISNGVDLTSNNTGLNLILAGNNQGKSQLFNSFNFGFFNRFFTEEDVDKNEKKMRRKFNSY